MTETPESSTIPPATSRYSIAATSPLWLALIVVLAALLRFTAYLKSRRRIA